MTEQAEHIEEEELGSQKREVYARFAEVWRDAIEDGIDPELLAHVALFAAFNDLIDMYGEAAVVQFAARLPERISCGEFTTPTVLN
ncbi:hypothetical protein [Faunimonas pinastri]|uniref:hypothetical protein n=1 Tax=Faunimonas pinastri TaxID=1855383 RepID=UPI001EECC8C1|nr:hypothetical protein [Faunimonas pinastri]